MLQVDHIYEFLYQELFKEFEVCYIHNGVPKLGDINIHDISVFTQKTKSPRKIFLFDQEPLIKTLIESYINVFTWEDLYNLDEFLLAAKNDTLPFGMKISPEQLNYIIQSNQPLKKTNVLVTSEKSKYLNEISINFNIKNMYYFFHGFAALDWYRGYYALNHNKSIVKEYNYDFISFNRIINNDRSYRIYFVSLLKEHGLLEHGQVSFNVTDNLFDDWQDEVADTDTKLSGHAKQHIKQHLVDINKLVIDNPNLPGSASADIPRNINGYWYLGNGPVDVGAFWHVVTETVFYYDKLHLTEKIFKPIVSKQPFMLLAAPGNLAYLKSYGFKTFDSVIDESYDLIQDHDLRTEAVVRQLHWYCNLTLGEKTDIIQQLEPIIEHNFDHFYNEFRHIITRELLDNTKTLFQSMGYDDSHINYNNIHHILTH